MKRAMPAGRQGFTLLELLVASGVIAFVSVIITQVLFSSIHLNTKTEVIKELKQTGEMTLGAMSRMIQNAASVMVSQCNLSTDDPKQIVPTVEITALNGGITTIECIDDAIAGVTRIASMSASRIDPLYITNSNVTLIDNTGASGCSNQPLQFTCVGVGGIPTSLSVRFRLRQKNLAATSYESAFETFQTTISVRNSTNE